MAPLGVHAAIGTSVIRGVTWFAPHGGVSVGGYAGNADWALNLWWSSYGTVIRVPGARQGDDEPSHRSPELIDAPHA